MDNDIAIIGLSCQFPESKDADEFWNHLVNGDELIHTFTENELKNMNLDDKLIHNPNYVPRGGIIKNLGQFDADFFGYTPNEALVMDPQQRFFLECAWHALEDSGYSSTKYDGSIGIYAGAGTNTYIFNIYSNEKLIDALGGLQTTIFNEKDYLTTRLSYKLNLHGPSICVQTACSTSLVSVHLACQSLLNGECEMAIAGGVRISNDKGYLYEEGSILSPDGHCSPFDAESKGTVPGNGVGVVILKRLEEAVNDGDHIYSVIKGSSVNNDGSQKIGYTAPSELAQASVIQEALDVSEILPSEIDYIETHGTGTVLGDPIEIAALKTVFRDSGSKCALGSVKANIGHLDVASGVAGLIKTTLMLQHKAFVPSINYKSSNKLAKLEESSLFVNKEYRSWPATGRPRRAGVSSFGIGGTNVHVVLEEAPQEQCSEYKREEHLIVLSAKTPNALETMIDHLVENLKENPNCNLGDVEYTLQLGRTDFKYRTYAIAKSVPELIEILSKRDKKRLHYREGVRNSQPVVFMYTGFGHHYIDMAREIYEKEDVFKFYIDKCCDLVEKLTNVNLKYIMFSEYCPNYNINETNVKHNDNERDEEVDCVHCILYAHAILFTIEYAMTQLLISYGIEPSHLIGYSLGEYTAACVSGVVSLEDVLYMLIERGKLIETTPKGAMLAVTLPLEEVEKYLTKGLYVSLVNSQLFCTVGGDKNEIKSLHKKLESDGIASKLLQSDYAYHTPLLREIHGQYLEKIRNIQFHQPQIPFVCNLTADWMADTTDLHEYWVRHTYSSVNFQQCIQKVLKLKKVVMVEIGPGNLLKSIAMQNSMTSSEKPIIISTLKDMSSRQSDEYFLLNAFGDLWANGYNIDWKRLHKDDTPKRVSLPGYPFEHKSYWVEEEKKKRASEQRDYKFQARKQDMSDWFYIPQWEEKTIQKRTLIPMSTWMIMSNGGDFSKAFEVYLAFHNQKIIMVYMGSHYEKKENGYYVNPANPDDFHELLTDLKDHIPEYILDFWGVTKNYSVQQYLVNYDEILNNNFYGLLYFIQAIGKKNIRSKMRLSIITDQLQSIVNEDIPHPHQAISLGISKVIEKEYQNISCQNIDVNLNENDIEDLVSEVINETLIEDREIAVAYRERKRYIERYVSRKIEKVEDTSTCFRQNGVYMVIGGLGGIGFTISKYLSLTYNAKLILVSRTELPSRDQWDDILADSQNPLKEKIVRLRELDQLHSEYLTYAGDAEDSEQIHEIVEHVKCHYGKLNGVIYTGGAPGGGVLQLKERKVASKVLDSRIKASLAITEAIRGEDVDLLVLTSSINGVIGGYASSDFCSANSFMDYMTKYNEIENNIHTVAIAWDTWREVGVKLKTEVPKQIKDLWLSSLELGLTANEGTEIFERVISSRLSNVIVSTSDLNALIKDSFSLIPRVLEEMDYNLQKKDKVNENERTVSDDLLVNSGVQEKCINILKYVFGLDSIDEKESFFDIGGNSLLAIQVAAKLKNAFQIDISPVIIYEQVTIEGIINYIQSQLNEEVPESNVAMDHSIIMAEGVNKESVEDISDDDIAIISMSGRFPGADTIQQFWDNLIAGKESLTHFTDDELREAGIRENLIHNPNYVKVKPTIETIDLFDAEYFEFTPREAEIMGPNHRLLLEIAWEALYKAGYMDKKAGKSVGVFVGENESSYQYPMYFDEKIDPFIISLYNGKDCLASLLAYKLNLEGPSVNVQSACSTSLVAVHMAIKAILEGECKMALAGGVNLILPNKSGYMYNIDGMYSPDGHTRAFDSRAEGMVFGDGAGIVLLKKRSEAIKDRDNVIAVIKGSAVNNDGSFKSGFTAPSVQGQEKVIKAALDKSNINPETISYVEAHGTGTKLGDPIEFKSICNVYQTYTKKKNYCAIGSVKSNIGHADAAAGVIGLIKAALICQHRLIPKSINITKINPEINMENSPFYINTDNVEYNLKEPLRVSVSAFGVGGTNAHIIMEEAGSTTNNGNSKKEVPLLSLNKKHFWYKGDCIKNISSCLDMLNGKEEQNHMEMLNQTYKFDGIEVEANELDEVLASIWKEILGIDEIKKDVSFFELGGNSLLALQLISRINKLYEINVRVSMIFENLTIEDQATMIEESLIEKINNMDDDEVEKLLGDE